jgi:hypothetical protein
MGDHKSVTYYLNGPEDFVQKRLLLHYSAYCLSFTVSKSTVKVCYARKKISALSDAHSLDVAKNIFDFDLFVFSPKDCFQEVKNMTQSCVDVDLNSRDSV